MNKEINAYNDKQISEDKDICNQLTSIIDNELKEAESKIWHAHPVWFLDGNPIVGFSKEKAGIRLMFSLRGCCRGGAVQTLKKKVYQ